MLVLTRYGKQMRETSVFSINSLHDLKFPPGYRKVEKKTKRMHSYPFRHVNKTWYIIIFSPSQFSFITSF